MKDETKIAITVTSLLLVIMSIGIIYIQPEEFAIELNDGTVLAKYKEGELRLYQGRYKTLQDEISVECYYDGAYHKVYKTRGTKYSNLSYYNEDPYHHIYQDIYFSRGTVTREFIISDYGIWEDYCWTPNKGERCRLRIKDSSLEEDMGELLYSVRQDIKTTETATEFEITLDWNDDKDKISFVQRYDKGTQSTVTFPSNDEFCVGRKIITPDNNIKAEEVEWDIESMQQTSIYDDTENCETFKNGTESCVVQSKFLRYDYTPTSRKEIKTTGKIKGPIKDIFYKDFFCKLERRLVRCYSNSDGRGGFGEGERKSGETYFEYDLIRNNKRLYNSLEVDFK